MKKFVGIILVASLIITGCTKFEENKTEKNTDNAAETSNSKVTESSKSTSSEKSLVALEEKQKEIKENTEAEKVSLAFENNKPIEEKQGDYSVRVNGYQYLKLENFSSDFRIPFGDQTKEGGVLLLSVTYKNSSKEKVYMGPGFSMSVVGYPSSISDKKGLLTESVSSMIYEQKYVLEAESDISGYLALAIAPEAVEKITKEGQAVLELPGLYKSDNLKLEDAVLKPVKKQISLTKDNKEQPENRKGDFYQDKTTAEFMGKKTMIINNTSQKSDSFDNINVSLEGYQIVSFEPNEDLKSRFSNFESGVVLATFKLKVANNGDDAVNVDSTSGTLTIGKTVKMMNENMLEVRDEEIENVGKGQSGTKYIVFALDKESYEKLYKDQEFQFGVSIKNTDFKQIISTRDISFNFSN
ncbi:hypothetical protein QO278_002966 [Listeria monocytogenes]|nr:hypothetical protein [Listeria monocytogenes]